MPGDSGNTDDVKQFIELLKKLLEELQKPKPVVCRPNLKDYMRTCDPQEGASRQAAEDAASNAAIKLLTDYADTYCGAGKCNPGRCTADVTDIKVTFVKESEIPVANNKQDKFYAQASATAQIACTCTSP